MGSEENQLHFVLFPFMAQGHMIPMVDIAKLLAQRGVIISIITTPVNAARNRKAFTRITESGLQLRIIELPFPCAEGGLREGCENLDMIDSLGSAVDFFNAAQLLQEPVEKLFQQLKPQPDCIISDMFLPYSAHIAAKFNIPRIIFHGFCCFSLLCLHNFLRYGGPESMTSESDYFVVPRLPDKVEFTLPQLFYSVNLKSFSEKLIAAELLTYGVIINTFEELEPAYVREFRKEKDGKVWCIGPLSLYNKDYVDKVERGNQAAIDDSQCLKWLDSKDPGSVIYVCLGSLCNVIPSQLIELALGLEASNRPFIWVARWGIETSKELEKWIIEDGFEERTKERGLVIRGWAPQVLILSHPAIGGFLTHCGWNSNLEGVCAGKPMVTWPLFADQFCNEKLVVQILKIGVSVGVKHPVKWGEEEKIGVLVKREDIKNAVEMLMDGGEDGEERRRRAKELGKMAKLAVQEGGSSQLNTTLLLDDIIKQVRSRNKPAGI
ncbi:UDP-glycosyltransferase 73C4-like [Mangifera indica]|uniref:UDP-glycosyltransferase 73C4-like n=1 Tax=Mangifera indica TaxID=29780 RepID=UPI001CFAF741|nr:UDP-glycosyltransferase 73C4-like [Mangifera indica]